jgi:hypothetical protein
LLAVGSLVVALASAKFAYLAQNAARDLAEQQFQSETTLRILETALTELAMMPVSGTSKWRASLSFR